MKEKSTPRELTEEELSQATGGANITPFLKETATRLSDSVDSRPADGKMAPTEN